VAVRTIIRGRQLYTACAATNAPRSYPALRPPTRGETLPWSGPGAVRPTRLQPAADSSALNREGFDPGASDDRLVLSHEALTRDGVLASSAEAARVPKRGSYWMANGEAVPLSFGRTAGRALDFHDLTS